jgi:hypothetical protein
MKFFLCAIILLATLNAKLLGQGISMGYVEFKENKVLLHYSLADSVIGRSYSIRLYSSQDGYLNPLEKITGDVGMEVKPGNAMTIVWDAPAELGSQFDGKVSLEIRGRIFIPFINVESINQYKMFKRKRKYALTWSGGTPQNILNFDLFKGEKKIFSIPNLANVGHHQIEFPSHIKPGKGYWFKISDTKNKEDVVVTERFGIRRKVPLLMKAIPIAGVGALVFLLAQPKANDEFGDPIVPASRN